MDELWNRLTIHPEELAKRPLLAKAGRAGLESQLRKRERIYLGADLQIQTDGLDVEEIVAAVVDAVSAHGKDI